jgi:hypothetical protein
MQEVKGWCLAQCNGPNAVGLITFGFTWYHKQSQLPKQCAFLTENDRKRSNICHSAQSSSLVYYVLAFLFYDKKFGTGLRLLGFYIMLNSHQDITSETNIQQLHCKEIKSHKSQHSPDTRQWLLDTCVYMKCSIFCIGSQDSMIGTATHYRLDGLETES